MRAVVQDLLIGRELWLSLFGFLSNDLDEPWVIGGPAMGVSIELVKEWESCVQEAVTNAETDVRSQPPVIAYDWRKALGCLLANS
jgi:hypothetical protein